MWLGRLRGAVSVLGHVSTQVHRRTFTQKQLLDIMRNCVARYEVQTGLIFRRQFSPAPRDETDTGQNDSLKRIDVRNGTTLLRSRRIAMGLNTLAQLLKTKWTTASAALEAI
jgi:hypothetical protein